MSAATESPQRFPAFNETLIAQGADPGDVWLVGWRCSACDHLSFGARRICGLCGCRSGRLTRLSEHGVLDTWTTVIGQPSYVIGYCLVGDGEDAQTVRLFGPLAVSSEEHLLRGQAILLEFTSSVIRAERRLHHRIHVEGIL